MPRGRRLTLLIIPEEGGRTYEYKIPRFLIWVGLVFSVAVLAGLGIGARSWVENGYLTRQVERLERDKVILSEEVELIVELEGMLQELEQSNRKLRNMAAEAVGLNTRDPEPERVRLPAAFISVQQRLEQGSLRTVPTLAPVLTADVRSQERGVLFVAARGAVVKASAMGRIDRVDYDRDIGYTVILDHDNGVRSSYGGLASLTADVGDYVHKGQALGLVGWPRNGATPGVRFRVTEEGRDTTASLQSLWL